MKQCHFADTSVLTSGNNAHNPHRGLLQCHSRMHHPILEFYLEISISYWAVYPVQGTVGILWELRQESTINYNLKETLENKNEFFP